MALRQHKPLIPQNVDELMETLAWMMLKSPSFTHDLLEDLNIDTVFSELNEGIRLLQARFGEGACERLIELSRNAENRFRADPEDKTGEAAEGRALLREMETLIAATRKRRSSQR